MSSRVLHQALLSIALLLALSLPAVAPVRAAADEVSAIETHLYFGLKTENGQGISEQAWQQFLADVVTPRFPDGLTVLEAYGQSSRNPAPEGQQTRLLIVVHPDTEAAAIAVREIKTIWKDRYPSAGLFHTESDVRIVE